MAPRFKARVAGSFYLITFLAGGFALLADGQSGFAAGLIAGLCYIIVTLLLYGLFKPVSRNLSLLAALISLAGCSVGPLSMLFKWPAPANNVSLVLFGLYCLLIGYLILKSTFLPHVLGGLMAFAGLGWLTFVSPSLAQSLSPYVFAPGIIGEGALTIYLLLVGVDAQKWTEQASAQ
ncbi:MAG TPA: DUF4386 family protein [Burkholderiaceae bacterium]|jgi:hypothetical protein